MYIEKALVCGVKMAPQQSSAMKTSQPKRKELKLLTIQLPETSARILDVQHA
jgi:hypothetical protein